MVKLPDEPGDGRRHPYLPKPLIPEAFEPLHDVFDRVGRTLHGERWTGQEGGLLKDLMTARIWSVPKPAAWFAELDGRRQSRGSTPTVVQLFDRHDSPDLSTVEGVLSSLRSCREEGRQWFGRYLLEWETLHPDDPRYADLYDASVRAHEIGAMLRQRMYSADVRSFALDGSSGKTVPVPGTFWMADWTVFPCDRVSFLAEGAQFTGRPYAVRADIDRLIEGLRRTVPHDAAGDAARGEATAEAGSPTSTEQAPTLNASTANPGQSSGKINRGRPSVHDWDSIENEINLLFDGEPAANNRRVVDEVRRIFPDCNADDRTIEKHAAAIRLGRNPA
jgi:hypothetical protein